MEKILFLPVKFGKFIEIAAAFEEIGEDLDSLLLIDEPVLDHVGMAGFFYYNTN